MLCPDANAIQALVDGTLADDERQHFEAHLTGCADCRGLVDALRFRKPATTPELAAPKHRAKAPRGSRSHAIAGGLALIAIAGLVVFAIARTPAPAPTLADGSLGDTQQASDLEANLTLARSLGGAVLVDALIAKGKHHRRHDPAVAELALEEAALVAETLLDERRKLEAIEMLVAVLDSVGRKRDASRWRVIAQATRDRTTGALDQAFVREAKATELARAGRLDEAIALWDDALAYRRKDPRAMGRVVGYAQNRGQLVSALFAAKQHERAAPIIFAQLEELAGLREDMDVLGARANARYSLALVYNARKNTAKTVELAKLALADALKFTPGVESSMIMGLRLLIDAPQHAGPKDPWE